jgi:prepilin-type processing-associated H-X9-DG protein
MKPDPVFGQGALPMWRHPRAGNTLFADQARTRERLLETAGTNVR